MLFHRLLHGSLANVRLYKTGVQLDCFFAVFLGSVEIHQFHVSPSPIRVEFGERLRLIVRRAFDALVVVLDRVGKGALLEALVASRALLLGLLQAPVGLALVFAFCFFNLKIY